MVDAFHYWITIKYIINIIREMIEAQKFNILGMEAIAVRTPSLPRTHTHTHSHTHTHTHVLYLHPYTYMCVFVYVKPW